MSIQIMLPKTLTDDNIINVEESKKVFTIKGKAQGAKKGDRVRLTVNGQTMSTSVRDDLSFTLYVRGSDLFASKEPQFVVSVSSKNAQGKMETVNTIHRYQIDNKPNTITPPPPPETPPPTIQLDAVTSDNFVNQVEQNGQIKISGRVGGSAKVGDKVEITIHNQTQTVTVQSDNTFQIMVSGNLLRDDVDHAIEATLHSQHNDKAVDVNVKHQYSAVRQVIGTDVKDKGQADIPYFIKALNVSFAQGFLHPTGAKFQDAETKEIITGKWAGVGNALNITYHFSEKAHPELTSFKLTSDFKTYTETQKQAVRVALKEFSQYANITFTEVSASEKADMGFYRHNLNPNSNIRAISPNGHQINTTSNKKYTLTTNSMCACCAGMCRNTVAEENKNAASFTAGLAYYGGNIFIDSILYANDTDLNKETNLVNILYNGDPSIILGGYDTVVHEIGHAVGLKHTFDRQNGNDILEQKEEENTAHSIMSYTPNNERPDKGLQIFDIATLHYRYGVNASQNAGNNTYYFKDYDVKVLGYNVYIWDGSGVDTFDASMETENVHVDLTPGSWNYRGQKTKTLITQENGIRTTGQSFIGYGTQIENLLGGSGHDTLTGNKADNNIYGGAGDDRINGNEGNDTLDGGAGNDTLIGGAGNDNYIVDSTKDIIQESLNQGNDTVLSSVDYTLGEHVENLTLLGNAIQGTGNALNNIITGNQANNILRGGTGSDTYVLNAGFGQDLIYNQNDGQDVLRLAHISHAQMFNLKQIKRQNNDLLLNVADSNDSVTVKDWFADAQNQIATIAFQDKSVTANEINALLANGANQLIQAIHTFGSNSGASTLIMSPQPNMKSTELLVSSS